MTPGPSCEDCGKPSTVFRPYEGNAPDIFLCRECKDKRGWRENFYAVEEHPNHPDNELPEDEQEKLEHRESGPIPGCDCHDCIR